MNFRYFPHIKIALGYFPSKNYYFCSSKNEAYDNKSIYYRRQ